MGEYKLSRYNHFLGYPEEGKFLVYNAVSNALARFEPEVFKLLRSGQKGLDKLLDNGHGQELRQKLRAGQLIVENDFDEVAFMRTKFNMSRFGATVLSLTIVPTQYCNLDCVYCYEGAKIGRYMNDETEDAVVEFTKKQIDRFGYRGVRVTWFGGEPLMHKDRIFSLSRKLIRACKERDVVYDAVVVTNGTALTKSTVRRLKSCHVGYLQVTIDGPKEVHDVRRPYKEDVKEAGKSSFEKIVRSVEGVLGIIPMHIRINVDKTNEEGSLKLVDWMQERGWLEPEKQCVFYIGYTRVWTSVCDKVAGQCFTMEEFSRAEMDFQQELLEKGFSLGNLYPSPTGYCMAAGPSGFVIDPGGELYKCWADVGNQEAYVGNVREPLEINRELLKWLQYEPLLDFPKCQSCKFFPICASGCPQVAIRQKAHSDKAYNCTPWKSLMRKKMELFLAHSPVGPGGQDVSQNESPTQEVSDELAC